MKTKIAEYLNFIAPFLYGTATMWSIMQQNTKGYVTAGIIFILFTNRLLNNHHKK